MSFMISMICILIGIFTLLKTKKIYNPIVLFYLWWSIPIFISGLGLFGLYIPSDEIYIIILTSMLSFILGCIFIILINKNYIMENKRINIEIDFNLSELIYKIVLFVNIILLIFLLYLFSNLIYTLNSGWEYNNIRYIYYYTNNILKSSIDVLLLNFIFEPILYFDIILLSMIIFKNNVKMSIKLILSLNMIFYTIITGGRTLLFYFIILSLVVYLIYDKRTKINISKKIVIIISLTLLVFSMIYITVIRSGNFENILLNIIETLVIYLTGSIKFLENKLLDFNNYNSFFMGRAFLGGVFDFLQLIVNNLLNIENLTAAQIIGGNSQIYSQIGEYQNYNAFPTMIYTFICDYGIIGIIINSFLFGVISYGMYVNFEKQNNLFSLGCYLVIVFAITESTLRWTFIYFWPYVVIILFFIMKKVNYSKWAIPKI